MFKNTSGSTVDMLRMGTPAGQEGFLYGGRRAIGEPHADAEKLDKVGMEERIIKAKALAPKYRTELLKP